MSDISKCSGANCPNKEECYRFMAIPSEFSQAYGKFEYDKKTQTCRGFYPIANDREVKKLTDE